MVETGKKKGTKEKNGRKKFRIKIILLFHDHPLNMRKEDAFLRAHHGFLFLPPHYN
jgi:hypothetical protein